MFLPIKYDRNYKVRKVVTNYDSALASKNKQRFLSLR